ncbi:MAG: N-acetylmuramoyl-L-alanine amidase [Deltaproteobacteria bacterium]|nr:N-acetylmuramoyl-L-alanine amidase [Deltaproteobacteria bacterium]
MRKTIGMAVLLLLVPARGAGQAVRGESSFVVVLDPGHGGTNTGAAGVVEGLYEKRFTLALSRAVAERLRREPDVRVVLTREDDRYVTLRERVRRANQIKADVLVSIHANASPSRSQRGFETYVLSPEALEVDARALRSEDGPPRPEVPPRVASILDDIERGTAQGLSVRLAERIQARLARVRGDAGNRGVKQGSMDVLMGPTMPAVLVEVGFIDHPLEGAELLKRETRTAIADALAAAVLDFREVLRETEDN